MPHLETLPEALEQKNAPTTSVYTAPLPMESAPPVASASLPFLVGETPEGLGQASEGEIAAAYAVVQETYIARNGGRPPMAVTAVEVWQEILAQRARASRERQRVLRENVRMKRARQQRRIAGGSAVAAGIALYFVARSILPTAPTAAPLSARAPSDAVYRQPAPITGNAPALQTYNLATLPVGAPGWVPWDTLVQLPQAAAQFRKFPALMPIQPIYSQAVPGATWQVSRIAGRLYLDAYAYRPSPGTILAAKPITLYPTRAAGGALEGQTPQPIHVLIDGQDFARGMHTIPAGSVGEAVQMRILRFDERLWQP